TRLAPRSLAAGDLMRAASIAQASDVVDQDAQVVARVARRTELRQLVGIGLERWRAADQMHRGAERARHRQVELPDVAAYQRLGDRVAIRAEVAPQPAQR